MSRIVVGVDGSDASMEALRWAAGEARLRGVDIAAVYAYEYTPSWAAYGYAEGIPMAPPEAVSDEIAQARQRAHTLLARAIDELGDTGPVTVETIVIEDRRPARALVDLSDDAAMLVLGSRGRGGFAGLLLGSVSQQCAQHARCPLVIIKPPESSG
jgi:nucleotide-binding universal stress UspA family protein